MWYLLKLLFLGPPSRAVEAPLRRQVNELSLTIEALESARESHRGQILSMQRRIGKLERELYDDEEFDEEDELQDMIATRRQANG